VKLLAASHATPVAPLQGLQALADLPLAVRHTTDTPGSGQTRFYRGLRGVLLILRLRVAARYAIWIDRQWQTALWEVSNSSVGECISDYALVDDSEAPSRSLD
jgi:hypothetical protein